MKAIGGALTRLSTIAVLSLLLGCQADAAGKAQESKTRSPERVPEKQLKAAVEFADASGLLYDLVSCTRRRVALVLWTSAQTGSSLKVVPKLGGAVNVAAHQAFAATAVNISLSDRVRSDVLTVSAAKQRDDLYAVTFAAGDCGQRDVRVASTTGGEWKAGWVVLDDQNEEIARAALGAATTVRAIFDLAQCSGQGGATVNVQLQPGAAASVVRRVAGSTKWTLHGPRDIRLTLVGPATAPTPLRVTAVRTAPLQCEVEFRAEGCGHYKLTMSKPSQVPSSGVRDWFPQWVEPASDGKTCSVDGECGHGEICVFPWQQWVEHKMSWVGSHGHCEKGARCKGDQDCPSNLKCDINDRVYVRETGVVGAICKPQLGEPTGCTTLDAECPLRHVQWIE